MASNLSKGGFNVRGWNRTPGKPGAKVAEENGVRVVTSIKEAVSGVSAVFLCVGDMNDVEDVLLGPGKVCDSAGKGTILVDTSTIGPDAAKSIHAKASERGFPFVDAPVTGINKNNSFSRSAAAVDVSRIVLGLDLVTDRIRA